MSHVTVSDIRYRTVPYRTVPYRTARYKEEEKKMSVKQRKVALMGFRSVGKSSLAIQFVQVFLTLLQHIYTYSFSNTNKYKEHVFAGV